MQHVRDKRGAERKRLREARSQQERKGWRPRRVRGNSNEVRRFTTNNVTCAEALREELEHGDRLKDFHYIFIQEHKLRGESRLRAEQWITALGMDVASDDAYIKQTDAGGGTAIVAEADLGVRPSGSAPEEICGRLTLGVVDIDGEVTAACVYGHSGTGLRGQRTLWCHLADAIKAAGRPFVIGGDWQVTPEDMRASGFDRLLGGVICASAAPTNVTSRRCIDYFLVSEVLLQDGWKVEVDHGCNFATHVPATLTIGGARAKAEVRRLATPRALPQTLPAGPRLPKPGVDWEAWETIAEAEKLQAYDEES